MNIFLTFALVFFIGAIDGRNLDKNHGKNLMQHGNHYYEYNAHNIPWHKAKEHCKSIGATLFYPEDENELKTVTRYFVNREEESWMWMGISRQQSGSFVTLEGLPLKHNMDHIWDKDEPNNLFDAEDCVVLMNGKKFNDYHCNALFPYICKMSLQTIEERNLQSEDTEVKIYDDDFDLSIYNYHKNEVTYEEAKKQCESEGATLFYPRDETEAGRVADLAKTTPWKPWIWIGITSINRRFLTVDNLPLSSVYENWYPTEPNNLDNKENCVVSSRDGTFKDYECKTKLPFICKKTPQSNKGAN